MKKLAIPFCVAIAATNLNAQTLLDPEDMRSAVFACSAGLSSTTAVSGSGDIEGFASLVRRKINAKVEGGASLSEKEIGAIFDELYSEDGKLVALSSYQSCLTNFILPVIGVAGGSGPAVNSNKNFTVSVVDATAAGDLIFLTLRISNFQSKGTLGFNSTVFRAFASSGAPYTVSDTGGLIECDGSSIYCGTAVETGDSTLALLTLEKTAGITPSSVGEKLTINGQIFFDKKIYNVGLDQIPIKVQ